MKRNAPLGHRSTHWGRPPQRSHLIGWATSSCAKTAPNGQASTHFMQLMHVSLSSRTTPSARASAPTGQASAQTGTLHWLQTTGIRTTGWGYVTTTRTALFFGLFTPKCSSAHTSSQILQPEHNSGITASFFDMPSLKTSLETFRPPVIDPEARDNLRSHGRRNLYSTRWLGTSRGHALTLFPEPAKGRPAPVECPDTVSSDVFRDRSG